MTAWLPHTAGVVLPARADGLNWLRCVTCGREWAERDSGAYVKGSRTCTGALTAATALQRSHQDVDPVVPAAPEVTAPHECQRCGSDEWTDVDYSGCSDCREAPEVLPEETP